MFNLQEREQIPLNGNLNSLKQFTWTHGYATHDMWNNEDTYTVHQLTRMLTKQHPLYMPSEGRYMVALPSSRQRHLVRIIPFVVNSMLPPLSSTFNFQLMSEIRVRPETVTLGLQLKRFSKDFSEPAKSHVTYVVG